MSKLVIAKLYNGGAFWGYRLIDTMTYEIEDIYGNMEYKQFEGVANVTGSAKKSWYCADMLYIAKEKNSFWNFPVLLSIVTPPVWATIRNLEDTRFNMEMGADHDDELFVLNTFKEDGVDRINICDKYGQIYTMDRDELWEMEHEEHRGAIICNRVNGKMLGVEEREIAGTTYEEIKKYMDRCKLVQMKPCILTEVAGGVRLVTWEDDEQDIAVIPEFVTEVISGAFSHSSNIRRVVLGKGVRKLDENAFSTPSGAAGIGSVTLNEGLKEIGDRAFGGNIGIWMSSDEYVVIPKLTIPKTVERISGEALEWCSLKDLRVEAPMSARYRDLKWLWCMFYPVKPGAGEVDLPDDALFDTLEINEELALNVLWYFSSEGESTIEILGNERFHRKTKNVQSESEFCKDCEAMLNKIKSEGMTDENKDGVVGLLRYLLGREMFNVKYLGFNKIVLI